MMNKRTRAGFTAGLVLGAALLVGFQDSGVMAGSGDSGRTPTITDAEAVARVRAASRSQADLKVTGTVESPVSRAFVVSGRGVDGIVDVNTGELGMLALSDNAPDSTAVSISEGEAVAAASEFLSAHAISSPKVSPIVVLSDHSSTAEFVVSWVQRVNGIVVPDQTIVKVNPSSGAVFSVVRIHRPFSEPGVAKVSKAEADAAARAAFGGADATLARAEVGVTFDTATGAQRVAWRLEYKVKDRAGAFFGQLVSVDATTGEILP